VAPAPDIALLLAAIGLYGVPSPWPCRPPACPPAKVDPMQALRHEQDEPRPLED